MFNLLTAEKIKVWKSRKMWVSLGLMVVLPLLFLERMVYAYKIRQ